MISRSLSLRALAGFPLVKPGDDLGTLLLDALRRTGISLANKDIVIVAQKIVSKAEGRLADLNTVTPSVRASALAAETGKDARLIEIILSESNAVIRAAPNVLIVAHRLGFVMANAGIDQSNVEGEESGKVLLLPLDPDASAAALKKRLDHEFGVDLAVIINDSFGRPWRMGVVGVALGAAGIPALRNMIGTEDLFGRKLRMTEIAVADEIASAASLLMGQGAEGLPAVHLRGFDWDDAASPASALVRPKELDLFR
jgi:coenzyme F420-0:L-glutamate ligase / coenzyme F420-1:gamma-L-glutamate ligase